MSPSASQSHGILIGSMNRPSIPLAIKKYISPAVLAYSQKEARAKLSFIKEHLPSSHAHLDVMDGKFVTATCWCSPAKLSRLSLPASFEVHLMVLHPERHVARWKKAGAGRIIFHYEATDRPIRVIEAIKRAKLEAFVALNPSTPVSKAKLLMPLLDGILIMGVVPGFAGQPYISSTTSKIRLAKKIARKRLVIVDGGVTLKRARSLIKAGASQLVSTSAVFGPAFTSK